jgi:hypothetical protein
LIFCDFRNGRAQNLFPVPVSQQQNIGISMRNFAGEFNTLPERLIVSKYYQSQISAEV